MKELEIKVTKEHFDYAMKKTYKNKLDFNNDEINFIIEKANILMNSEVFAEMDFYQYVEYVINNNDYPLSLENKEHSPTKFTKKDINHVLKHPDFFNDYFVLNKGMVMFLNYKLKTLFSFDFLPKLNKYKAIKDVMVQNELGDNNDDYVCTGIVL